MASRHPAAVLATALAHHGAQLAGSAVVWTDSLHAAEVTLGGLRFSSR
jgi:hypothetical protein